jgi:hypothetical protein
MGLTIMIRNLHHSISSAQRSDTVSSVNLVQTACQPRRLQSPEAKVALPR